MLKIRVSKWQTEPCLQAICVQDLSPSSARTTRASRWGSQLGQAETTEAAMARCINAVVGRMVMDEPAVGV